MGFDSRLYVDLLHKSESYFGCWEPSCVIKAGEYGHLDSYGQFVKKGDIYDNKDSVNDVIPNIAQDYKLITSDPIDSRSVFSTRMKECNSGIHFDADFAKLANARLNLQLAYSGGCSAFLVVPSHTITRVPDKFLDESTKFDCLKGMMLVTRVINCCGYVRYLSTERSGSIKLALTVGNDSVSGGPALEWKTKHDSGSLQATYKQGRHYTPLFQAKEIKQPLLKRVFGRRRGAIDPNEPEDDYWADAAVPWGNLDDDGKELELHYRTYEETDSEDEDEMQDDEE